MKYYVGNDYEEVNIHPETDFIGEGIETKVYQVGDYVFKIYKDYYDIENISRKLEILHQLSEICTKRIVMPREMVYRSNDNIFDLINEYFSYQLYERKPSKNARGKYYCGYTSLYIHSGNKPINLIDTDKIYENFLYMSEDFELLNKEGIIANDTHIDNIIFDENGNMFLVDIGSFYKAMSCECVDKVNHRALNYMVKENITAGMGLHYNEERIIRNYLSSRLDEISTLKFLKQELCNYSTIEEYQKYLKKKIIRS